MSRRSYDMDEIGVEVERIDKTAHLKTLPESVRRRLAGMEAVHKEFLKVQMAYRDELDALRRKYMMSYAPIFHRRAALLSGESEPTAEELAGYVPSSDAPASVENVRGVPYFWYHALMNNTNVRELLGMSERDKEALKYLLDISVENLPRTPEKIVDDDADSVHDDIYDGGEERSVIRTGYKLIFTFQPNPFFSDTVLTKTYHMHEDDATGEQQYDNTEATKPNWFPGKDLTVHLIKKTQRARTRGGRNKRASGGASRIVTVEEPCPSFFNFFSPPDIACAAEMSSEDFEITSQLLHEDWSAGNIIKKDIIPLALLWYRGECDDDDEEEEYIDEDNDDDDDDDGDGDGRKSDDDDDDDDDDDYDDANDADGMHGDMDRNGSDGKNTRIEGQKPLPATAGETPQECKQQ